MTRAHHPNPSRAGRHAHTFPGRPALLGNGVSFRSERSVASVSEGRSSCRYSASRQQARQRKLLPSVATILMARTSMAKIGHPWPTMQGSQVSLPFMAKAVRIGFQGSQSAFGVTKPRPLSSTTPARQCAPVTAGRSVKPTCHRQPCGRSYGARKASTFSTGSCAGAGSLGGLTSRPLGLNRKSTERLMLALQSASKARWTFQELAAPPRVDRSGAFDGRSWPHDGGIHETQPVTTKTSARIEQNDLDLECGLAGGRVKKSAGTNSEFRSGYRPIVSRARIGINARPRKDACSDGIACTQQACGSHLSTRVPATRVPVSDAVWGRDWQPYAGLVTPSGRAGRDSSAAVPGGSLPQRRDWTCGDVGLHRRRNLFVSQ